MGMREASQEVFVEIIQNSLSPNMFLEKRSHLDALSPLVEEFE